MMSGLATCIGVVVEVAGFTDCSLPGSFRRIVGGIDCACDISE